MELETCQGLRSNRLRLGLYRLEATTLCGKGAGGFPLHPCHVANAGVGSAHGVGKTLGGRAVEGTVCRRHSFKGFGGLRGREPLAHKAQWNLAEIALCSLAWLSGDRWAHVASVAKAAPCALRPLIT